MRATMFMETCAEPSKTFFKLVPLFRTKITCFTKIL